jgi:hypothetical protein
MLNCLHDGVHGTLLGYIGRHAAGSKIQSTSGTFGFHKATVQDGNGRRELLDSSAVGADLQRLLSMVEG